jgi:choloylglycine hydrolase
MDWDHHFGERLVIYPRGMKVSGAAGQNSATWTSKYGSVGVIPFTFFEKTMHGDEEAKAAGLSPYIDGYIEGINEKGLTAHMLYLGPTQYEVRDNRPGINYARFLRYMLDNYATVEEVLKDVDKVQVVPFKVGTVVYPLHFALEDPAGDSAIIEFVKGEMKVYHGREHRIMTNDPEYDVHLENLKQYKAFGGAKTEIPGGVEPDERFIRAAIYLKTLPEPKDRYEAVAFVYSVIRNVSVPFGSLYRSGPAETYPTWWTNAEDVTDRVFYFNWTAHPNVVWVDLKNVDFSKGNPLKTLDPMDPNLAGDVTKKFKPVRSKVGK